MQPAAEFDELRGGLEQIRALLDNLVVRGLRACGPDELAQIGSFATHLDESGAGHLASLLSELRGQIERDEPTSARKLLETQTSVRLLERLLTLVVVKGHYAAAVEMLDHPESVTAKEYDSSDAHDDNEENSDEE